MARWRDLIRVTNWSELTHAYGTAEDVPDLLEALTLDADRAQESVDNLFGNVLHQGTIYPATIPAMRVLGRMLAEREAVQLTDPLLLLFGFANSVDQGWTTNPEYLPPGTNLEVFDRGARAVLAQVAPAVQGALADAEGEALLAAAQFFRVTPDFAEAAAADLLTAAQRADGAQRRALGLALAGTSGQDRAVALLDRAGTEQVALWRVLRGMGEESDRRAVADSTTLLSDGFDGAVWDSPDVDDLADVDPPLCLELTGRALAEAEVAPAARLLLALARRSRRWGPAAEARLAELTEALPQTLARDARGLRSRDYATESWPPPLSAAWTSVRLGVARAAVRQQIIDRIRHLPEQHDDVHQAAVEAARSAMLRGAARADFLRDVRAALEHSVATPGPGGAEYRPYLAGLALLDLDDTWRGDPQRVASIVAGTVATPIRTAGALRLASSLTGTDAEPALRQRLTELVESDRRIDWLESPVSGDEFVVARVRAWLDRA